MITLRGDRNGGSLAGLLIPIRNLPSGPAIVIGAGLIYGIPCWRPAARGSEPRILRNSDETRRQK